MLDRYNLKTNKNILMEYINRPFQNIYSRHERAKFHLESIPNNLQVS